MSEPSSKSVRDGVDMLLEALVFVGVPMLTGFVAAAYVGGRRSIAVAAACGLMATTATGLVVYGIDGIRQEVADE